MVKNYGYAKYVYFTSRSLFEKSCFIHIVVNFCNLEKHENKIHFLGHYKLTKITIFSQEQFYKNTSLKFD